MDHWSRFAVYYLPAPGPLARFGAAWLGWDCAAGQRVAQPEVRGLPRPLDSITGTPQRYGFHGTLKPPFRLAAGTSFEALVADLDGLAHALSPVSAPALRLSCLGRFLALVPAGNTAAISELAAQAVAGLDHHRAPASDDELARRRAAGLTPAREANLVRWGYPFVMDAFRFHITLTGPLDANEVDTIEAAVTPMLAPVLPEPFRIDHLCLCGEDVDGFFHLLRRVPLAGRGSDS